MRTTGRPCRIQILQFKSTATTIYCRLFYLKDFDFISILMPENPLWRYWYVILRFSQEWYILHIGANMWHKMLMTVGALTVTYFSLGMENQYSGFFFILENAWMGAVPETDLLRGFPRCRHRYRGGSSAATAGRGISSINRHKRKVSKLFKKFNHIQI